MQRYALSEEDNQFIQKLLLDPRPNMPILIVINGCIKLNATYPVIHYSLISGGTD